MQETQRRSGMWWIVIRCALLSLFLGLLLLNAPRAPLPVIGMLGRVGPVTRATVDAWALERTGASTASALGYCGEGVVIAIVDSGVGSSAFASSSYWSNEDEIENNGIDDDGNGYVDDLRGWDFVRRCPMDATFEPPLWHGTFVAGLMVDPAFGVAPCARIMDLRVADEDGSIRSWDAMSQAIRYAMDNGASIINLSLAFHLPPPLQLIVALDEADGMGIPIVGIAGNGGGTVPFPGRLNSTWTVGAIDAADQRAAFSGSGEPLDLCAPGVEVASRLPDGGGGVASGTSFAAAQVSGALALVLATGQGGPAGVQALLASAEDLGEIGWDPIYGHGRLRVDRALVRSPQENP